MHKTDEEEEECLKQQRGGRMHKTDEEEEECTKAKKQTPTRQHPFKKGCVGISGSSTHGVLYLEKVFCGLRSRTASADVNKIKSSECSASVLNLRCEFTRCSYKLKDTKIDL